MADPFLEKADILWEDSTVGSRGHIFCVGVLDKSYFYFDEKYDTYEKQPDFKPSAIVFEDFEAIKAWLRELKAANHPKAREIIDMMKFFLL